MMTLWVCNGCRMYNRFFAPYNVLVVTCFGNFVIIFVCSFEEVTPGAMNKCIILKLCVLETPF